MSGRAERIRRLHRARPRRPFVTASLAALVAIVVLSWLGGDLAPGELLSARQRSNAERFVAELRPWPLQGSGAPTESGARLSLGLRWFSALWKERGAEAVTATLATSIAAILLAGLWGGLASLPAARNLASPQPFLPEGRPPSRLGRAGWRAVVVATRTGLSLVRALPEYVWAFLLLGLLGPSAWPMILALALHNTGILGKLGAEVLEDVDARAPAALRGLGAERLPIAVAALLPLSLPRFLLFFFYRWETCVRESTVLGMLGMASLGYWIVDARARNTYDEMLFYILCGMGLVLAGDLVSAAVRRFLRRA